MVLPVGVDSEIGATSDHDKITWRAKASSLWIFVIVIEQPNVHETLFGIGNCFGSIDEGCIDEFDVGEKPSRSRPVAFGWERGNTLIGDKVDHKEIPISFSVWEVLRVLDFEWFPIVRNQSHVFVGTHDRGEPDMSIPARFIGTEGSNGYWPFSDIERSVMNLLEKS